MILDEQGKPGPLRRMSMVQWDMYTGSGSYKEIFMHTLHPSFLLRLGWDILASLVSKKPFSKKPAPELAPRAGEPAAPAGGSAPAKLGKRYQPGEVLIQQGELGDSMFVIQEGQVAIMQEREGEEVFVGVRSTGEILGEMAIFDKEVHNATVRALSEVVAITVDKDNFNRRIHEDPSMAYRLFQLMSRRTRELSQQVTMLNQEIDRLTER